MTGYQLAQKILRHNQELPTVDMCSLATNAEIVAMANELISLYHPMRTKVASEQLAALIPTLNNVPTSQLGLVRARCLNDAVHLADDLLGILAK